MKSPDTLLLEIGLRILLVEDEDDLRTGIAQVLREENYAVDEASEGRGALAQALAVDYDAIVLDLMIPQMDGFEVLTELRKTKATPVLILTARNRVEDRVNGLDIGADDYLPKPFQNSELTARLRAIIRRSSGQTTSTVVVKEVTVDLAAQQVFLNQQAVEFTSKEFALIRLLVTNKNKVVTRTLIYDHCFDDEHDSLSNLVDVYISRIRSKLGKDFVLTRRGSGYIVND